MKEFLKRKNIEISAKRYGIGTTLGLAGGAAVADCCARMIGFAVLPWVFCEILRRMGWLREGDLKLP